MTDKLRSLLDDAGDLSVGAIQDRAAALFSDAVKDSHLQLWEQGEDLSRRHDRVTLIKIFTWSVYDLNLLSELENRSGNIRDPIYVFNIEGTEFNPNDHFEFPDKFHSPFIVMWENGKIVHQTSGWFGREWLRERYYLSSKVHSNRLD